MHLHNRLNSLFLHIPSVTSEKVEDSLSALQLKTIYRVELMEKEEEEGEGEGGRRKRRRGERKLIFFIEGTIKIEAFAEQAGISP